MCLLPTAYGFIEELFGGGGGFSFGGGGGHQVFEMGGGGRGRPKPPKWPRGVPSEISKPMAWMKGTEWTWNNWAKVKFQKDGTFEAPVKECQGGGCLWSADDGKVFVNWNHQGIHEVRVKGKAPVDQTLSSLTGLRMEGQRHANRERCYCVFHRVFDHEAFDNDKDIYEVLGLDDDADEAAIKKVYRHLSKLYHPDKNPDAESRKKFADIRDAYEVLNDPDKKILYDTGGMEAVRKSDKGEIETGSDVNAPLEVSLADLYNSGKRMANYNRRVVCRGCRAKPNSPKCRGCTRCPDEKKVVQVQMGPFLTQQEQAVPSKEKCKNEDSDIEVHIEKGMRDGEQLTFARMAEQRPGMLPGNVILTLKAQKHPKFTRRGNDLHMDMQVSLREALLGWTQKIRHLDNHIVEISTDSVTKPMQVIKVKGEGMPLRDDPASFGDLVVKVEVIFPKKLDDKQRDQTSGIFSQTQPRSEL
jgi:DnaJ-class molecular chaperone